MTIHPDVGEVATVHCIINRAGRRAKHTSEMVWIAGAPVVVIEWEASPEGDRPLVTAPLDPKFLQPLRGQTVKFLYQREIRDPRPLH